MIIIFGPKMATWALKNIFILVVVHWSMDEECAIQIHTFLHNMKEPYKEVFTLRVFGELPFDKIGMLFGKSSSWARVVFYRAKMQIKEYMEEVNHE